jgi:hypothetical protein
MLGPAEVEACILKDFKGVSLETRKLFGIIPRAIEDILQAIEEL